jgi:hypothetical protein
MSHKKRKDLEVIEEESTRKTIDRITITMKRKNLGKNLMEE